MLAYTGGHQGMSAPKIPIGFVSSPGVEVQGYLDARAAKHRNRHGGEEDESVRIFRQMQAENKSFIQNPGFHFCVEEEARLQSYVQVITLFCFSLVCVRLRKCTHGMHTPINACSKMYTCTRREVLSQLMMCGGRMRAPVFACWCAFV